MSFEGSCACVILVRSPTLQPVFIGKKLEQDLKPKEAKPSIDNQQCVIIILYVICVVQIMSATQPDTFFNVLLKIWQSANFFMMRMIGATF